MSEVCNKEGQGKKKNKQRRVGSLNIKDYCQSRKTRYLKGASPGGAGGKELTCQCRRLKRCRFDPCVGKIFWRRRWQPIPVFLPGESYRQRRLAGYSPKGHKQSDTTEHMDQQISQRIQHPSIHEKMKASELIELIPFICISAIWGQFPVLFCFSHSQSLQGVATGSCCI